MEGLLRSFLLGITLAAPIGPAGVTVIQTGLRWGFWRAFLTGLGITTADLTYMLVVYFGLARFIEIPAVQAAIWSLGAIVLVFLGVQSLRTGGRRIDFAGSGKETSRNPFLVGYLVNISNPIAVVFWLGIFGSLISASGEAAAETTALQQGLAILAGILTWHTSMSMLTHWGKRFVNERSARIISIVAGLALIGFGLRFAYNAIITIIS